MSKKIYFYYSKYIMPYKIIRMNNGYVRVKNSDTGQIKAKKTTIEKAKKQIRLLKHYDTKSKQKYL